MKKIYDSKYLAGSKITAAQYLTEFICERIAKKEKTTLCSQFWETEKWNKVFIRQIAAANKLLRIFSLNQIIRALEHPKGKWISSLGVAAEISKIIGLLHDEKVKPVEQIPIPKDYTFILDDIEEPKEESTSRTLWQKLS